MNQARSLIAVAAILSLLALSITILGQRPESSQTPVENANANRPMRGGSLLISQRFTTDLEQAASSLRIPVGSASVAPASPYAEIRDALKRFESLPGGRRAMLVVSDGLDVSHGVDSSTPSLSLELD